MSGTSCFCPDCAAPPGMSRRSFLQAAAAGLAALPIGTRLVAADSPVDSKNQSESLVGELFKSLTDEQRGKVVFPFDHPLRSRVDANWHITPARVERDFDKRQQELIREIFLHLHSEQYAAQVLAQVEQDNSPEGFGGCSLALFGEPGKPLEFVFTGRHVTRRCDGDSVEGTAFGGPIFYGHAAQGFNEKPDHPGNAYWYQAKRANELFQALDGKQRKLALRSDPRAEKGTDTVQLQGQGAVFHGVSFADLASDQKELARKVMADVLAPFREADAIESMKLIEAGGWDNLHMAYYSNMDIGGDGVWDVWQVEGPQMVWYFRGSPHVHTWVNIRQLS